MVFTDKTVRLQFVPIREANRGVCDKSTVVRGLLLKSRPTKEVSPVKLNDTS